MTIPLARCEFCHQPVEVGAAAIFGPEADSPEEMTDLAARFLRGDPDLELIFMHEACDILVDGDSR
jgi:hypothetical protein